jgi:hypothetical protein
VHTLETRNVTNPGALVAAQHRRLTLSAARSPWYRRKRARSYIRSPDQHYDAKLADLAAIQARVQTEPERFVLLYLDEVTIERQPSLAPAYHARVRREQPRAQRSWSANTETRVVATLAANDGRVVFRRGRVSIDGLVAFYQQLCAAYGDAQCLYVVQDN